MNDNYHSGDNINQFGNNNIGKIVGGAGAADSAAFWREARRPRDDLASSAPLVFINYRGTDDKAATYIDNELTRRLGHGAVFRDAKMPTGTEFPHELLEKARTCAVMITIIGERWDNTYGLHLLDDPNDWVRREIATALRHSVHVAPVLVGARARPRPEELPADIRRIADIQARHLRSRYDEWDVRQLVDELVRDVPALAAAAYRAR